MLPDSPLARIPAFTPLFRQMLLELLAEYGIFYKVEYRIKKHGVGNFFRKVGYGVKWAGSGLAQVGLALTDTVNPISGYHNIVRGDEAYFLHKYRNNVGPIARPEELVPNARFNVNETAIQNRLQSLEKILLLMLRSTLKKRQSLGFDSSSVAQVLSGMLYSVQNWVSPNGTNLKGRPGWLTDVIYRNSFEVKEAGESPPYEPGKIKALRATLQKYAPH